MESMNNRSRISIKRRIYRLQALIFILSVCATAATCTMPAPAQAQVFGLSEQEEIQAGQEVAAQAEKEFGGALPANHPMSQRVRAIGAQFARLSERKNIPYSYQVLNNDEVLNAFAAPGGPIYVTRRLVTTAANDAELAYVLGHETAHIDRKHIVEQVEKQQKAGVVAGILGAIIGEGSAGNIVGTIANIGWTVISRGYSRDDENESDTVGVRWMSQLGYDPNAAISMLGKLGGGSGGGLDRYLSTHPAPQDRQQRVQDLIRSENLTEVARRNGGPRLSANLPASYYASPGTVYGYPGYSTSDPPYYANGSYDYGYNTGARGTMNATVTRDLGLNQFEVRADDNRLFTVRLTGTPSRRLYVGERVQLTGYVHNNNVFVADAVAILPNDSTGYYGNNGTYNDPYYNDPYYNGTYNDNTNNNGRNNRQRGTMVGTVSRDLGSNRFEVRADDNRLFTVRSREGEPRRLRLGDRVELIGYINNRNIFVAESVRLISATGISAHNGNLYPSANDQAVDFSGTVQSQRGNIIQVRGDNGQTYSVRRNNDSTFRNGERVRIVGTDNNGTVQATSINRY